jgi:ABC-type transporter Mla subunit MlaD
MAGLVRRNRRSGADEVRIPRKDRRGASPVVVGLVLLVLAVLGSYLGFRKDIPFTKGYRINAVFESANSIRANSPVRVAGVNVGKVQKITRYADTDMSVVEMEINDRGLPIHKDATAKIRSRIFLEGNFFVDLSPGTPNGPTLEDGDTIRVTQTSSPVQLDQLLTALQKDTRHDLQTVLEEFGTALDGDPAASDAGQDPSVKGQTAGQSLNDTYKDAGPALRGTAIVNEALLGTEPHDLSGAIKGLQRVTAALGRNESLLQDWLVNFNRTLAIFADEKQNVSATIRELPGTLANADRAFASLNGAFPATRAFAREILPGVRETPSTIDASRPWVRQARQLMSQAELQGLARDLRPTTKNLAIATDAAIRFFPQQDLFAKCLTKVLLPAGDIKIQDGPFTTGSENYKSFWYTMVGLAGESQNFDGNGQMVRFQTGGGSQTFATGPSNQGQPPQFFRTAAPPIGVRPVFPGTRPPYRPDVPCFTNKLPDLNSARSGPPEGGQGQSAGGTPGGNEPTNPLPSIPPLPRGAKRSSAPAAKSGESLGSALVKRLNPWRQGAGG